MNIFSLIVLIFSPLIASGIVVSPLISKKPKRVKFFSIIFSTFHLLYTACMLLNFNPKLSELSYKTELTFLGKSWLEQFGISWSFGVDALAMSLVCLCSLLFFLAVIVSKNYICSKQKLYYSLLFLLQTSVLGVFCATDMFVFFMFWELELIPMYFLISHWGSGDAKKSAMKFVLYTFFGSIFLLFGIICIYFSNIDTSIHLTGNMSNFDIGNSFYPQWFKYIIFGCCFIGFAIKLPVIPFHTWLPDAHSNAATPVSMLLAGILLKMGAYGLIRFNIQIFPEIFGYFAPILLILGAVNILLAGISAFCQKDIKRTIAYSSIAHMGIVLIGLGALNKIGLEGAIFQLIAHGLTSAGLFLVAGSVYIRTKTRNINELGGLAQFMPQAAFFAIIIFLASSGVPFLIGFPAEFMAIGGVLLSDINVNITIPTAITALVGLVLTVGYLLNVLHKTFYGTSQKQYLINDLSRSEFFAYFVLSFFIVFFGIAPFILINFLNSYDYFISIGGHI